MSSDIRVNTGFLNHHKTRLLRRRLGGDAVLSLEQLWCYCAEYKPAGDLSGMSDDAIEEAASWPGDPGALIKNLTDPETTFIDGEKGNRSIHDWLDHNPYAAGAPGRSDRQRFKRLAGSFPHIYNQLSGKGIDSLTKDDYQRLTTGQQTVDQWLTSGRPTVDQNSTPYPSPSPLPLPVPGPVDQTPVDQPVPPAGFDPDRITSDTPLPPLLQAEWDRLLDLYPKPRGIVKGRDKAVRLFAKSAERARILANAERYAASSGPADGYAMNLDTFVSGGFRDYDEAEQPLGTGPPGDAREGLRKKLLNPANKCMPGDITPAEESLFREQGLPWGQLAAQVRGSPESL